LTEEGRRYIAKAQRTLANGRTILSVNLGDGAGRAAYLAAFHAAQAFIFERAEEVAETHKGVQLRFAKLAASEPRIDPNLRRFLTQAYVLKSVADYETGTGSAVPLDRAAAALATAAQFVDCIIEAIG
jgi:uncharacterized protein (UPF0332 family)